MVTVEGPVGSGDGDGSGEGLGVGVADGVGLGVDVGLGVADGAGWLEEATAAKVPGWPVGLAVARPAQVPPPAARMPTTRPAVSRDRGEAPALVAWRAKGASAGAGAGLD
jgi:hypothetical protein